MADERGWRAVILKGHEGSIRVLSFAPDGKTLASGSDDKTIKLWDVAKKNARVTLKGHAAEVTALTFSPQGKTLASGGADNTVILWDPATGTLRERLRGHNDALTSVLFAADGRRIVTAGLDRALKVWQALPSPIRLLRGHTGPVMRMVISRDGRRLLTGSGWPQGDKTARLWDLKTGKQLHVFRAETPAVDKGLAFYTILLSRRRSISAPATRLCSFCQPRQSVSQPGKPSALRFLCPPLCKNHPSPPRQIRPALSSPLQRGIVATFLSSAEFPTKTTTHLKIGKQHSIIRVES